jgi:hypothetical protein
VDQDDRDVGDVIKKFTGDPRGCRRYLPQRSVIVGVGPRPIRWFPDPAAANGASIFKMMNVSRHKSVDTLRGYVRDSELFKDHAGAGLL